MKYLKKFENHAAYEAAESGLILPNVSYCIQENEIHYNPSSPTPPTPIIDGHEYVEIGGLKWATMNIGASSITDYGKYFQWSDTQGYTADQVGEDEGKKYFGQDDYIYYDTYYTKYNYEDDLTTLQSADDAVANAWGGNWRMPTVSEYIALGEAVNTAWTADYNSSGVAGLVCTDKTDSSKVLFFPACGNANNGSVSNAISGYWSSLLDTSYDSVDYAYSLGFNSSRMYWNYDNDRYLGLSVRGVVG